MRRRSVLRAGSLLVAAISLGMSGITPAAAGPPPPPGDCTDGTLDGLYVFTASGFNIVSGVPQPKAIIELIHFYGDGTLDAPGGTNSINGTINPIPIPPNPPSTGTYTLQSVAAPDKGCTGTIAFNSGPSFFIFTAPDGKDIQMIQTNPNTVFRGSATRVSK
jgi:hypothetical protein